MQELKAQCLMKGHCLNDPCNANNKCSGKLSCNSLNICVINKNAIKNLKARCIAYYDCGAGLKCQNEICTNGSTLSGTSNASSDQKIENVIPLASSPNPTTASSPKATPLTPFSKPKKPVPVADKSRSTDTLTSPVKDQNQTHIHVAETQSSVADPAKVAINPAPSQFEPTAIPVEDTSSSTEMLAPPIEDQNQIPIGDAAIKSSVQDSTNQTQSLVNVAAIKGSVQDSTNQTQSLVNVAAIKSSVADSTSSTPSLTSDSPSNPTTDIKSPVSGPKVPNSEPQYNRASDHTVLKDPKVLILIVLACCFIIALVFFIIYRHQTKKRSESGKRKDLENHSWNSLSKVDKNTVDPVYVSSNRKLNGLSKEADAGYVSSNRTLNGLTKEAIEPMYFSSNRKLNGLSKGSVGTIAPSLCTSRSSNQECFPISYISTSGVISDRYTNSPFDFAFSDADGVSDVQTNSYPSWLPPIEDGDELQEDYSEDIPSYHAPKGFRTSTFSDETARDTYILAAAKPKIQNPSKNGRHLDQMSCLSKYELSTLPKFKSFDFVNPDSPVFPPTES